MYRIGSQYTSKYTPFTESAVKDGSIIGVTQGNWVTAAAGQLAAEVSPIGMATGSADEIRQTTVGMFVLLSIIPHFMVAPGSLHLALSLRSYGSSCTVLTSFGLALDL